MAATTTSRCRHAGAVIAETLAVHGVRRVFVVPGESYLALLDGLHDTDVDVVVCRQEGGAAYMADATARMGAPVGVAAVTRGPGAANAFVGVHSAWQDAVPLVLLVGLVPVRDRGRESFQEFDLRAWFGTQTKRVLVLEEAGRAGELVAEAIRVARSGRPGPVVVGLPEDVLAAATSAPATPPQASSTAELSEASRRAVLGALRNAERPVLLLGGHGWTPTTAGRITAFAERNRIPVVHEWRSSDRVPFRSRANVGWLGYGARPTALDIVQTADVIVCVGTLLGDVATDGGSVTTAADATVIAMHPDHELLGTYLRVHLHHAVPIESAVAALHDADLGRQDDWEARLDAAHAAYLIDSSPSSAVERPAPKPGTVRMDEVMAELIARMPNDALVTFGAGNHTSWAQRWFPTAVFPSMLSVRNGSMGYSVPAAVAAALAAPERLVVTIAGDGELLMNGQELATATQEGAAILAIVMDNAGYGTIRSHQERDFPDRPSGTALRNPDFAALARAMGAHAETIAGSSAVVPAVERALAAVAAGGSALLHVMVDPAVAVV